MERRVSEQERRAKRVWIKQLVSVSIVLLGAPFLLLWTEPTQEETWILVAAMTLGAICLPLGIRELRRLPHVYRFEDANEDVDEDQGRT